MTQTSDAETLLQGVSQPGTSEAEVTQTSEGETLLQGVGWPSTIEAEEALKRSRDAAPGVQGVRCQVAKLLKADELLLAKAVSEKRMAKNKFADIFIKLFIKY